MLIWVVVVKNPALPVAEQYRVYEYEDLKLALSWAERNGWKDPYKLGASFQKGVEAAYRAGDIDVSILLTEVQKDPTKCSECGKPLAWPFQPGTCECQPHNL
jgi:hypothetical protein